MPTILQNHYVLAVHDLKKSSGFFVEVLGFEVVLEPPGWIFVKKDDCLGVRTPEGHRIMIGQWISE